MKRFSEQFNQKAQTVKLTAAERAELRERVHSYLEYHPLPSGSTRLVSRTERLALTEPFRTISLGRWRMVQAGGLLASVLLFTASWQAEGAVPGDALYAMKVNFNEEVRSTLTFAPFEKVTWEAERLNRRIAEARQLAGAGKLTPEVEEAVVVAVRTHGDNARREIAALHETDSEEAAIAAMHLASTLDVQSVALRPASEGSLLTVQSVEDDAVKMPPDIDTVRLADVVDSERSETEAILAHELPSYERLLAHAEMDTTRARELLASIEDAATPEERQDITRRLEDIDRLMARALEMADGDTASARPLLADVLQRSQKLVVFMTNIDVRTAVPVEVLVPVEYTPEEEAVAVRDVISRTRTKVALIETALVSTTLMPDVASKISAGLVRMEELLAGAEDALGMGVTESARVQSNEAAALATDLGVILGIEDDHRAVLLPPTTNTEPLATTTLTTTLDGVVEGASTTASGTRPVNTGTTTNSQISSPNGV